MADLLLSENYKAVLRCTAPVEFLEGTTAAGKTTVGLFKFILRCAASPKRLHVLAGLDQGTIEKNIITKELGVLDLATWLNTGRVAAARTACPICCCTPQAATARSM